MKKYFDSFIKKIAPYQQYLWLLIFLQALAGTLGSLYYSTFGDPVLDLQNGTLFGGPGGFTPCELCWYARVLLYPITLISLIGILNKDQKFVNYVLALSLPGILLELYHYSIQMLPGAKYTICSPENPCTNIEVSYFGFITIPFLSLIAFIVISLCAYLSREITKYWKEKAV
mgnify:CR=1 FL=1